MAISPPWRTLVAVAGLAVALGLVGCSSGASGNDVASLNGGKTSTSAPASGSGSGNAQSDASEQDAMVKFAQCMRQHGVDMPDPKPGPGGGRAMLMPAVKAGSPGDNQKIQAASTACDKLLPNGGKPTAQDIQRQLKFAQCMRAHGVDVPDPNPNGGSGKGMTIDGSDPKTKTALNACGSGLGISDSAGSTSGK
ncbi:MAG TPA: hypothetical protein VGN81_00785 [Pseudonocardiaceae bacterium]|jgi:hypothetical protein